MIFGLTPFDFSVTAGKSAIILISLLLCYRLLGKREVAQFNVYDLVTVVLLCNAVQNAMTSGRGEFGIGVASAGTLLAIGYLFSRIYVMAPQSQRILLGAPVLLIRDGVLLRDRLKREKISEEEVFAVLRTHGLLRIEQVDLAVLELDGSVSVVPQVATKSHRIDLAGIDM